MPVPSLVTLRSHPFIQDIDVSTIKSESPYLGIETTIDAILIS
jgi:hypothetical protein